MTAIRIKNGFNVVTAARKWTDNHRVKGFRIRAGGKDVGVEAEDRPEAQYKENLGMRGVTSVEIEIVSVYPTTHWTDVAITEIQFFSPK